MASSRILVFAACLQAAAQAQEAPNAPTGTPEQQARSHFNLGRNHFTAREYEEAIAEFQAGYHAKPLPLFLFNIGQAARKAGKTKIAIENYRQYILLEPLQSAPELAVARRELADLMNTNETPEQTTDERSPPAVPPAAPAPAPVVAPSPAPLPAPATVATRPVLRVHKPWYKDTLGDVLTGGGVAVLGASVGIWASGYRDFQAGQQSLDKYIQDQTNGSRGRQIVGLAGIGLGGVLVISGVVRYLVRPSRRVERAALSVDEASPGARMALRSR